MLSVRTAPPSMIPNLRPITLITAEARFEGMADHHAGPRQAFRIGGPHEILLQDLDHGGAHQPADDGGRIDPEGE
jgi:hypothetical protein